MSDILIKNMRMPKGCCGKEYCQFVAQDYTGKFHCTLAEFKSVEPKCLKSKRPNGCPLVEVKPHGDLIDRDEAMAEFADRMCVDDILDGVYEPAVEVLRNAPTVMEANE